VGNRFVRTTVVIGLCVGAAACSSSGSDKAAPPTTTTNATGPSGPTSPNGQPTTTTRPAGTQQQGWSLVPAAAASIGRPVAWTGTEALAATSACCDDLGTVQLSAYDPASNTWHALPHTPLTPRNNAAGAWTGSEMVVAGGFASPSGSATDAKYVTDGAAWNAHTNSWHAIAPMPTTFTGSPTAVWTGREVLVWSSVATFENGGREVVLAYNPTTDKWRTLPASGLAPRNGAVAVWTGSELVVWGGNDAANSRTFADGARLDPATGMWRRLPPAPVPGRALATAAWSGHEVLLWGGQVGGGKDVGQGAAYNPVTNSWRALPASPLRARALAASAWTGKQFIVVGGSEQGSMPVPGPGGASYDPSSNTWTALPTAPEEPQPHVAGYTADQREDGNALWTGKAMVILGGRVAAMQAYNPDGIAWTPAG
jgi:N-acetylneuraminic acid mutarotase